MIWNSGRIDPSILSPETQRLIMALKVALANERDKNGELVIRAAQITFDQVQSMDTPPTMDIKVILQSDG